jgi:hypothetical protein
MANQTQATKQIQNTPRQRTLAPAVEPEIVQDLGSLAPINAGKGLATGEDPTEGHLTLLSDARFQTVQRQFMAREIGRLHGNGHLQRLIAVVQRKFNGRKSGENRRNGVTVQRAVKTGVIQRQGGGDSTPIPLLPDLEARRALALKVLKETYGGLIRQQARLIGVPDTDALRTRYDASMIRQGKTFTENGESRPWQSEDSKKHKSTSGDFPGFYDPRGEIIIDESREPDEQVVTIAHEYLHASSAGDMVTSLGRDVDEGMTESLTQKAFQNAGYSTSGGYFPGQMAFIGQLSAIVGENTMKFAYFRGVGILRSMMDNTLEEGIFDRFVIQVRNRNWDWLTPFFERYQRAVTGSEIDKKVAAVNSLLDWWVSDADIGHIENIWNGSSEEERRHIRHAVLARVSSLNNHAQRVRLRSLVYG